jgi:methylthioribose-1-phosphate isomerase
MIKPVEWLGSSVRFLDQTKLPLEVSFVQTDDHRVLVSALRSLAIRGAPLIGITTAYGIALAALRAGTNDLPGLRNDVEAASAEFAAARPTAVNLFAAIERMRNVLAEATTASAARRSLVEASLALHREDEVMCKAIGRHGAALIPQTAAVLTHCNTGSLATGGIGTALGVITTAAENGKRLTIYADETRPLLQGARLTMWELLQAGLDATLITDNTAAYLMAQRRVDLVIVGADRIASNGDAANKIGTYGLAVLARHHRVPFYIAAPSTTIDARIASGKEIIIEERDGTEVAETFGHRNAPPGSKVYSPAFDVTPAALITAIITEHGVHYPPYRLGSGGGRP